jgi:hypothetical protein
MSEQPELSDADRQYLVVLDASSAVASSALMIPVELVEAAVTAGRSALEEPGEATPEDLAEVRAQLKYLDTFLTFRKALEEFVEDPPPPSALERAPGNVSPGGVVLP